MRKFVEALADACGKFAQHLQKALEKRGHEVFLCAAGFGDQFGPQIRKALYKMTYFLPLITLEPKYGQNSGGTYTTYFELQWAHENKRRICPVMMFPGSWPPTQLEEALKQSGDEDGAAMVAFAFLPSLYSSPRSCCFPRAAYWVLLVRCSPVHVSFQY